MAKTSQFLAPFPPPRKTLSLKPKNFVLHVFHFHLKPFIGIRSWKINAENKLHAEKEQKKYTHFECH